MILGIDVDSVIADLSPAWFGRYNKDYNDNLTNDRITEWATEKFVKPECGIKIYDYLTDPTLYDDVEPIQDSLYFINLLREKGHRIVFITMTPIETPGVKFNWLVKHGYLKKDEKHNYVECRDKSLINVDILLDDRFDTIRTFPRIGVIFDQPWNRLIGEYTKDKVFPRVKTWQEFYTGIVDGIWLHPTARLRPAQVEAFDAILQKMRQTHLDKNADYSPANILGTGEIGLVTRLWDKMARLMNLTGFRIEIASSTFAEPLQPKNESVEDTLTDLSVYAIIGLLLRQGKWGK